MVRFGLTRAILTRQATVTLLLVLGLTVAFAYAVRLSYYGATNLRDAFTYQTFVVAAQRDSELLEVEQFDRRLSTLEIEPYEALLSADLLNINRQAESLSERAPHFSFPLTRLSYDRLTTDLQNRETVGKLRFDATVDANAHSRDISNALFAFVALLFVVVVGRLRQTVEEGRSLVERLQRAFISRRREVPGIDLGSVLISSTRGSNVGGDTHDAFTLDRRHAMFLVADVSGKGIDAAVDTALIKYTIRTLFSLELDPAAILTKFAQIYASTAESPETFVVVFLAIIDLADGTVRYASAGHEPAWSVVGKNVATLAPTGSIVNGELEPIFESRELKFRPGDALVVATDGLTESRDSRGELLGASGVVAWLSDEMSDSAQGTADAIVRRLRKRSSRITDDLAILVIRYAPDGKRQAIP
jgi:serine phosphatase RsbU (regulator of sigma subunit)